MVSAGGFSAALGGTRRPGRGRSRCPIASTTRVRPWRPWDYTDPSTPRSVGKSVLQQAGKRATKCQPAQEIRIMSADLTTVIAALGVEPTYSAREAAVLLGRSYSWLDQRLRAGPVHPH